MTSVEERVVYVAGKVRESFLRKNAPANPDDVFQDAALAMLEVLRAGKLDVGQNVSGYFWRVGKVQAGVASSKLLSKVYLPTKKAHLARKFQRGVPIQGCGATEEDAEAGNVARLAAPGGTSDHLAAGDAAREEAPLKIRQRRLLERHALALGDFDRRVVTAVFGLGDDPPPDGGVGEVAFSLGVSEQKVRNAVERYAALLRNDAELRRLRRNMRADGP